MGSTITYRTAEISEAAEQINAVAAQTEDNRLRSIQIVTANADNFNGQGSQAFQDAIALVNQRYGAMQETIAKAGRVLAEANASMTERDMQAAAQYGG
ncbi:hypothetical protein KL864_25595 [Mycolicibacterium goodii]|uniref:hypothetical protein n=1 Tax=Mycolicibacterium goodii TaxID=134601 RepID=UPI001BDDC84A|nr:hypothetical protein [Mycolicibacterium goodii]MBU8819272.1 hypothetical protein [Mycolicibacterium goodii]